MKPEHYSSPTQKIVSAIFLKQFGLLSSLGAIGIVLAISAMPTRAEAESNAEVNVEAVTPTPVEAAPAVAPVETSAESLLKPQVTAAPTVEPSTPAPAFESAPSSSSAASPSPSSTSSAEPQPATGLSNTFIDPTDYSLGATTSPDRPALIFSDRSSGCQFTLQQGQAVPNRSCGGAAAAGNGVDAANVANGNQNASGYETSGNGEMFSMGPVSIGGNGVTVGNTTVISREYFNEKLRSLNLLRRGVEEFVFPLAIPSPITSLFGWRTHPIFGDRRFHSGTDLGAPEGTPVVATQDGEVHTADYLGGYGLTVILRHAEGSLETRYAHLSRILVRPGETVEQGDVIGLVGSTGNSTGPHLHFELRELTAQGWILHDPDELMQFAVANLADVLNNPMLALGLDGDGTEKEGEKVLGDDKQFELPYRPAQPNAN